MLYYGLRNARGVKTAPLMSTEVQTASAGADQKPVGKNLSSSELIAARFKALSGAMEAQKSPPKPKQEQSEPSPVEQEQPKEEARTEEPATNPQEAQSDKDTEVLSKDLDLENMSEAELKELAQKLGSKAVARFGELTAKRKAAEEQLAALKAEIEKREETSFEPKVKDNPYANIASKEELDTKYQEIVEVMEWAENHLDKSEDLAADDVVTNENGREYTKRELREVVRRARKAKDVFIPDQGKQIKLAADRDQMKNLLTNKAKTELPWLQGEDNDVRKQYEALMSDSNVRSIQKMAPDFAAQLPYLLAHAANSIYGRRSAETKPAPRLSPPSPVVSQSTESTLPQSRQNKALNDLSDRFAKTGRYKDFAKFRALQFTKI